jgi:glycosyltransferase involved in cell wall biosynthesis
MMDAFDFARPKIDTEVINDRCGRILLVAAANATTGGGERHVADLARGLVARGWQLGIAAPAGGDLEALATELGVRYFGLALGGRLSFATVKKLRAAIDDFAPDIVHAHGTRAASFARLADPKAVQRVVYTLHGIHLDRGRAAFAKLALERVLLPRTAAFICVCQSDLDKGERLRILNPQHSWVVYNGVTPLTPEERARALVAVPAFRTEAGVLDDELLLLHVGRVSSPKNHRLLLNAFASLRQQRDDVRLALIAAGADEERAGLCLWIKERALDSSVRVLPTRDNLAAAYCAADALVLSSEWEGLPYVVLEAANAACPIVSTDVGGIPEAVSSPEEGLLTSAGDVNALAMAFGQICTMSAQQRARMGALAQHHVQRDFTLDAMIEETEAVYHKVLLV